MSWFLLQKLLKCKGFATYPSSLFVHYCCSVPLDLPNYSSIASDGLVLVKLLLLRYYFHVTDDDVYTDPFQIGPHYYLHIFLKKLDGAYRLVVMPDSWLQFRLFRNPLPHYQCYYWEKAMAER